MLRCVAYLASDLAMVLPLSLCISSSDNKSYRYGMDVTQGLQQPFRAPIHKTTLYETGSFFEKVAPVMCVLFLCLVLCFVLSI